MADGSLRTSDVSPGSSPLGGKTIVLKLNASGLLGWSAISVSGYDGVAWDYDVRSGSDPQTIPLYKGIVVPGPMTITDGTVIVNGRLHVI